MPFCKVCRYRDVEGDLLIGAVRGDAPCGLGGEVQERRDGAGGLFAGAELEEVWRVKKQDPTPPSDKPIIDV